MSKGRGQISVTNEVAYCSFCGRPRNLRREEHRLGGMVRTIVTCESCHRTLSSSMGVATPEPSATPPAETAEAAPAEAEPAEKAAPSAKAAPAAKASKRAPKSR